ncbi:helix-turn-helix transcriptional regulator [Rhizobium sp. 3T7]|uniref:helix-turn-helix transcriptional regulator n=1 Tax=Rhizobium sp. 3T7 TaxID=2874922 RepID=UPI001CCB7634|nr:helix-turn-helix transcriptional regulator [Rhizobium sp. 3T7]MBZ9791703.1 helix-turn-helix transcriptional regulator [Rhizobium sp. 3T7]
MKIDITKLNAALDRVIEAAFDHSLWPGILQQISDATTAFGVNILPLKGNFPGGLVATESLMPALEAYFDGGWQHREWRMRGMPLLMRQGTALEQHYTSRDDFERQEYYRAQSKYGLGRTCAVALTPEDDLYVLALHRRLDQDPFNEEDEQVIRLMRDRLMVAVRIMQLSASQRLEGMKAAFEVENLAAVFFDRFGKVTTLNAAAEKILGSDLKVSHERILQGRRHSETIQIQNRMKATLSEEWLVPGSNAPILIRREEGRPILLRLQRLGRNLNDLFSSSIGVCIIDDLEKRAAIDPKQIALTFGLTITESTLASTLASGAQLREASELRKMSYETARSHLRSIFSKTGVRRQSELVDLISGLRTAVSVG